MLHICCCLSKPYEGSRINCTIWYHPTKASFLEQTEDILINSDRAATVSEVLMGDAKLPKEVLEFMTLVMENFNPFIGALPILTDEQLNSLTMSVLYVAGTNDTALDSTQAAQRLSKFVSHAKIQLNDRAHVITSAADHIMPLLTIEFSLRFLSC